MRDGTTRRDMLGIGGAAIVAAAMTSAQAAEPALDAGSEIPTARFAFAAKVLLEPTQDIGRTPYGQRRRVPIIGGTFQGPRIRGTVMSGGADWQLQRADNFTVIEADYMIRAEDGTQIHVYNRGLSNLRVPGSPPRYLRTVPQFEAPSGPHEWLNQSIFVGTITPFTEGPPAVMIRVFSIL